jgi:hypothetical protein|tara:strand:+ start:226 stop:819 length:594 start_codon:yes stop_codon:yes gene_type:complete
MALNPVSGVDRQPDKLDYASPTQFRFGINQLPKVEFFTTACNLPGINLGQYEYGTPFKNIPIAGDKLTYEQLNITFIVDEFLENYRTLHEWMVGIGFPKNRKQFSDFRSNKSTQVSSVDTATPSVDSVGKAVPDASFYSDAFLIILSNKNNPIVTIDFQNCFPVSLSSLQYDQSATDVNNLIATATFSYQIYEFLDC